MTRSFWPGNLLLLSTVLLALVLPDKLAAHPFEVLGFTSRAVGMGSGATASASAVGASYYNPAAAIRSDSLTIELGALFGEDFLAINDEDADLDGHRMVTLGLASPLPLGSSLERRIFVSAGVALPMSSIYDVRQPDDQDPSFPFLDARNRRLVLMLALSGRITDWLSIGVGTSLLPNVNGGVEIDLVGGTSRNVTNIRVDYNFAPTAGVLISPLEWLDIGVAYRGAQTTEISIPVNVDVISGVPPIYAQVEAPAYSVPHELALGFQVRPLHQWTLAGDVTWYGYSAFRYNSPDVVILDSEGRIVQENRRTEVDFSNVLATRLGLQWEPLSELSLRAGFGRVPSPVPAQEGYTNLLDATRHEISLGLGWSAPEHWLWQGVSQVGLNLHARLSLLNRREFEKMSFIFDNPGYPQIIVSGGFFNAGLDIQLSF